MYDLFYVVNEKLVYSSVNGTDMRIYEPSPSETKRFSHTKVPGIRYETTFSLNSDSILSSNDPFPYGKFPDMKFQVNYAILYQMTKLLLQIQVTRADNVSPLYL